jgi:transcription-repair coupling factor (superfamily II helicase)
MPKETRELIDVVKLRWKAIDLSMEKIILKNEKMICYFVSDPESPFYKTKAFISMVQFVQKSSYNGKLKEQNHKLTLTFPNIQNVEMADFLLKEMQEYNDKNPTN